MKTELPSRRNEFAALLEEPARSELHPEILIFARYLAASYEFNHFEPTGESEFDDAQMGELETELKESDRLLSILLGSLDEKIKNQVIFTLLMHLSQDISLSVLLEFLDSSLGHDEDQVATTVGE